MHRRALGRPRDCGVGGCVPPPSGGLVGGSGGGDQQLTHAPSSLKSFHSSYNTWVLRFGGMREKFENFIILLFNKNETSEKGSNNINFWTLCWRMDSYSLLSNPLVSRTSLCLSVSTSDYWHLGLGTLCWGGSPVHCRMVTSIPGLSSYEARSTFLLPKLRQPQIFPDIAQCSFRGKISHRWKLLVYVKSVVEYNCWSMGF